MGQVVRAPTKAAGNVTTLSLPTDFYSLMRKAVWSLPDRGCWVTSHFPEPNSNQRFGHQQREGLSPIYINKGQIIAK